ncbi:Uncharacterised protein [Vibrio cholerae]|nr:Uncharacterised protein [Vibrio cholerae]
MDSIRNTHQHLYCFIRSGNPLMSHRFTRIHCRYSILSIILQLVNHLLNFFRRGCRTTR